MIQVIAYKPKCCNKAMLSKQSARRHEKACLKNPDNKTCLTCKYLEEDSYTVYNPHHGGNPGSTDYDIPISYCTFDENNIADIKKADEWEPNYKVNCENWRLKHGKNT